VFSILMYFFLNYSCDGNADSHDPSEIILIRWFALASFL